MLIHMVPSLSSHIKGVYTPKCVILHAALLHQSFLHCAIFLTAASRRSLVRVSVPVWRIILSNPLPVIALVSSYLTNKLMGYSLISKRKNVSHPHLSESGISSINHRFQWLSRSSRHINYILLTRAPLVSKEQALSVTVRLACVKHAASVHSEPGSNSP